MIHVCVLKVETMLQHECIDVFPSALVLTGWHVIKESCSKVAHLLRTASTIFRMKLGYCFCNM
jgi:hypothetical protein